MPESDQRSIHAWPAQQIVESAGSQGCASVRRASANHSSTAASVAAAPSSLPATSPSAPMAIASASNATHSGLVAPYTRSPGLNTRPSPRAR